jgi:hypothetical protein
MGVDGGWGWGGRREAGGGRREAANRGTADNAEDADRDRTWEERRRERDGGGKGKERVSEIRFFEQEGQDVFFGGGGGGATGNAGVLVGSLEKG